MNQTSIRKNNGEPVVVISNLDSEQDITTMVDQLLSNNELSDASSIFVVVPTSDDNDSDLSSDCSTICIEISKHQHNWNQKKRGFVEPETSSRRESTSMAACGLKISAKGKMYCLDGMQETVASFHNKENISNQENFLHYKLPKLCSHNTENKTKNKLCQISTPDQNKIFYHGVSTDTTSDRPCCCAPKNHENHYHTPEHRCVSELVTPLFVNHGPHSDGYNQFHKVNVTQQASFVSVNRNPTPVSPSVKTQCHQHHITFHPSDIYEKPFDTTCDSKPPLLCPPHSESNITQVPASIWKPVSCAVKQSEPCQCSPEKIKEMFEQVLRGKTPNLKSTGCGGECNAIESVSPTTQKISEQPQAFDIATHSGDDDDYCFPDKYIKDHKMDCACNVKKISKKIPPSCPCEKYLPPVSMSIAGPKPGTRSVGCQCCCCDEKEKGGRGPIKVLDPAGGVCQMEPGGTYCQAGRITVPTLGERKKNCACVNGINGQTEKKKGFFSRNKNVICECPQLEPEPKPDPKTEPEEEPEIEPEYYQYQSYRYIDEKQVLRQKSDMTQTQSGFRMFKKKKPPVAPEPEFTVEDAVRYYVAMNPDFIKEFIPPPPEPKECPCSEFPIMPDLLSMKSYKKKNNVQCECPPGPPIVVGPPSRVTPPGALPTSVPAVSVPTTPPAPVAPEQPQDEGPSGGLKFTIGGKGSGSKGLSGVCCFDMIQKTELFKN